MHALEPSQAYEEIWEVARAALPCAGAGQPDLGKERGVYKPYALLSQRSLSLLRQEANVRQYVLHFSIGELPTPRMHRTEDDAVLDSP